GAAITCSSAKLWPKPCGDMRLVIGAATDVGRVRDGNEDAYLVDDAMGLVAVADGMGGHRAGEVASATALETLRAAITGGRPLRVDVYPIELTPGDRVLFCSDGLTGMVQADEIAATLRREDDPTRAATQLVDAANVAGGEDNITVVVVAVTDEAPARAPSTQV